MPRDNRFNGSVSSLATAFDVPGHAFYIDDPHHFSILSLSIDATTQISTRHKRPRHHSSSATQPTHLAVPEHGTPHSSTARPASSHPPMSASASAKTYKPRPMSLDIASKAREALSEFSKLTNRKSNAHERLGGADTLAEVVHGLSPSADRSGNFHPLSSIVSTTKPMATASSTEPAFAISTSEIHASATNTITVKPQSYTFGKDNRLTNHIIPLHFQSESESKTATSVEFVVDPDPRPVAHSYPASASELETEDKGRESLLRFDFDPARLLLKVAPPAQLARQKWSNHSPSLTTWNVQQYNPVEAHHIYFRFRLHLCDSSSHGSNQILFLSAESPSRLIKVIASPAAALATNALASLEGVTMLQVSPTFPDPARADQDARECGFNWTWKPLGQSALQKAHRCCCAFVEIDSTKTEARVLASFSVWIEIPGEQNISRRLEVDPAGSWEPPALDQPPRSDSGIDSDLHHQIPIDPNRESLGISHSPERSYGSQSSVPVMSIDWTELSLSDLDSDSPVFRAALAHLERRTHSIKKASKAALKSATETKMRLLYLIEAEEAMARILEGLATIAPDTLGKLQQDFLIPAADNQAQRRRQEANMIEQYLEQPLGQILDVCRSTLEQFSTFEAESKSYYSQTQKWLSNPGTPAEPVGHQSGAAKSFAHTVSANGTERSQKQDRGDEKQRLRELHFERSRLEIYAANYKLHGGKMEAQLAHCMLLLCQWHSQMPESAVRPSLAQHDMLTTFGDNLQAALTNHDDQNTQLHRRKQSLVERIRSIEHSLAGDENTRIIQSYVNMGQADGSSFEQTSSTSAHKGNKFKSFMGAITHGMQGSSLVQKGLEDPVLTGESQRTQVRRRPSVKTKSEQGTFLHRKALSFSVPTQSSQKPLGDERLGAAVVLERASTADQQDKFSATKSHRTRSEGQEASNGAPTKARSSVTESDVRSDEISGAAKPVSATKASPSKLPNLTSNVLTDVATGSDRKKEGVLWVMSKSVTGPAGADAPRAVNRSTHWRECWVAVSGSGQVSEFADWKGPKKLEPTHPLIDLRFATVREARGVDRRFVFEIVTRDHRRFFQASDEESMKDWIRAIVREIESLLNGTSSVRKLDRAVGTFPFSTEDVEVDENSEGFVTKQLHSTNVAPTHTRGISNKTPTSVYFGKESLSLPTTREPARHSRRGSALSDNSAASSISTRADVDLEFDRNIESSVQKRYGSIVDEEAGQSYRSTSAAVDAFATLQGSKAQKSASNANAEAVLSTKASRAAEVAAICRRPGNASCADCRKPEPRWASWMLANESCCIFICIDCSGVHRSLGVHISKVRSVDLDDWSEEQLESARTWGNVKANEVWEWSKPEALLPATNDRREFWQSKYVEAKWKKPLIAPLSMNPNGHNGLNITNNSDDLDATPTRQDTTLGKSQYTSKTSVDPVRMDAGILSHSQEGHQASSRPIGPRALRNPCVDPESTSRVVLNSPQKLESEAAVDAPQISSLYPSAFTLSQRHWPEDDHKPNYSLPNLGNFRRTQSRSLTVTADDAAQARLTSGNSFSKDSFNEPQAGTLTSRMTDVRETSATSSFFVSNLAGRSPSPLFTVPSAIQPKGTDLGSGNDVAHTGAEVPSSRDT